jgi:DNA polymerase-3 subunit alpha (Gram-positive type)
MEIGAFRVRNNKIIEEFETLVNPNALIPANIIALTGITNEMVQNTPQFSEIINDLLEFIGDSVLIAHNAPFDMGFLNSEINRVYPERKLANTHFCTVRLSRKLLPDLQNHRLHTIAEHFSIPIYNRHRAGGDALATAKIFVRFLEQLHDKGVTDVAALKNLKT